MCGAEGAQEEGKLETNEESMPPPAPALPSEQPGRLHTHAGEGAPVAGRAGTGDSGQWRGTGEPGPRKIKQPRRVEGAAQT